MSRPHLLVFELHHMGDALLSLPFLRWAGGQADVTVVCHPRQAEVYRVFIPEDRLRIFFPPWKGREGWTASAFREIQAWRGLGADAAVSIWPDVRIHACLRATGARVRVGFAMNARNIYAPHLHWRSRNLRAARLVEQALERCAGPLLTHALDKPGLHQPPLAQWGQIAGALGEVWGASWNHEQNTRTPWMEPRNGRVCAIPAIEPPPGTGPLWILHPDGGAPMRCLTESFCRELERVIFRARGWRLWVMDMKGRLGSEGWGPGTRVVRTDGVADFLALLSQSSGLVAVDSFATHAAASMGCPVVSIFTSQEPAIFAPHGFETHAVHRPVCPHRPCLDRCLRPTYECREALTVADVADAIDRHVQSGRLG